LEFYTDAYDGPKQYVSLSFWPIDGAAFLMNYIMSGIAQVRLLKGFKSGEGLRVGDGTERYGKVTLIN